MKEMSKVLAAAMIAGTLAACTSKPAETPAPAEETPAAAETAPAETAAAAQEDGQNPVMNVIGDYQADRCSVHVEAEGKDGVKFTVHWGSSATEASEWTMSGTFDAETTSVYYQDCVKVDRTYDDKGEVVTEGDINAIMNEPKSITGASCSGAALTVISGMLSPPPLVSVVPHRPL